MVVLADRSPHGKKVPELEQWEVQELEHLLELPLVGLVPELLLAEFWG